jgi:L-lactate dehydrogenase
VGIGMATARIVEAILRDEEAVMPVGAFNPNYGTTLSLPSVLGRAGVSRILEPDMSEDELQAGWSVLAAPAPPGSIRICC